MTTVSINYDIKDLFNQNEWELIEDEFSCPICCDLIYKQEWYQCNHSHHSCSNCWNKIISNGSKQCSSCRVPIGSLSDGLSRCILIEQSFADKKICCPYSYKDNIMNSVENNKLVHDLDNGCKDIITVEQLEDHQKICNSRFVKCNNESCSHVSRYIQHLEHEKECQYAIIKCELCDSEMKRSSLTNHKESCPSRIITCIQCPVELKISKLEDHIDKECPNTIIPCKFQPYGCKDEIKRSELSNHLEQVNHTTHMLKLIDNQSKQLDNQSQQIDYQSQQLNSQSKQLNNQSKQLDSQSKQLDNQKKQLNNQSKQLDNQSQQLDNQSKKLDQYKKELQGSNNKYNDILNNLILNNGTSYSDTWIISNFLNRTGVGKDHIYSPIMNVPPYQFRLSTSYKNNTPYYYLNIIDTKSNGGTIKIKFTIKLLNHKDSTMDFKHTIEHDYEINGQSWGDGFININYSIDSGYIFPDGSVHLKFTIDIPKPTIQS